MENLNIIIAFFGGLLSIFSPCVLPVLPSFLGYISGVSLSPELQDVKKQHLQKKLFLHTIFFVLGFSVVFMLFGAVIGLIGQLLLRYQALLQKIGGIIIIIFGLQLTGILKLEFLTKEKRLELGQNTHLKGYIRSFLIGVFFAFGWAPCYGPVIGTIFTLAATNTNFLLSLLLFFFYSLGFSIPLLLFSLLIGKTSDFLKKHKKLFRYSSVASGLLVILLGVLLFTNQLNILVNWIDFQYTKNNLYIL